MALTQIRDIAFVKTEPQNKYNLWLHFKEKKALVLEMWVNGAWREVNSFWGTEGNVDPEPTPVPPEQGYPILNFNSPDNNIIVIESIEDEISSVILKGIYNETTYNSIGTYNSITHTITITYNTLIQVFEINVTTGNITLLSEINITEQSGIDLPVFDLNNTDGINIQVLEDISNRYLPDSTGVSDCYISVLITGVTTLNYGSSTYETNINHYSIASFNYYTNTIVCTEGVYKNIFSINDTTGNISLEYTIDLHQLSKIYTMSVNDITIDTDIPIVKLDFNPLYYSEIRTYTSGILQYNSYFKESNNIYKNIVVSNNPNKITVYSLIWNAENTGGYFTKSVEYYNIENNYLLGFALHNLAESYSAHLVPYDQDYYNYVKDLATCCYYASKSITNCPFAFSKTTKEVTLQIVLQDPITFSCPTYTIKIDNNNYIEFYIGWTEYESTTYYYPRIDVTLNNTTTSTTSSLTAADLKNFIGLIMSYVNTFPSNWN